MTEEIHDQISAFSDDELSPDECEFLVRRMSRDPESRDKVLRYAVIGTALRGDLLGPDPDLLRTRLRQSLDGVSLAPISTQEPPSRAPAFLRPALGAGIAAGVAVLGLLALNYLAPSSSIEGTPVLAAQQVAVDAQSAPAMSYVVPQDTESSRGVTEPAIQQPVRLTNYLLRHGEYAIGIGRTSIHSNVVSGQDTWRVADERPEGE